MLFTYKAIDTTGAAREGTIEAVTQDVAISSLQRRGLVISSIKSSDDSFMAKLNSFKIFNHAKVKDIVILSRQMAVLFDAQVPALRIFSLLAAESESAVLRKTLSQVFDDIQGGSSISKALERHPRIFSSFYVNVVRAGEESGKMQDSLLYLADYLERNYETATKARNALIYPAFVITTFVVVMILIFIYVIPEVSSIIQASGAQIPVYTKVVIAISAFLVHYGIYLGIALIILGGIMVWYLRTPSGKMEFDHVKLAVPFIGGLFKKLYLARIADNMYTMLVSGITVIKALEVTSSVVDNDVYRSILDETIERVKAGSSLSDVLNTHKEIPGIMVQMVKVGEETGQLGPILKTLSRYYEKEVDATVDTLVDLIEPIMIVVLGVGVGILMAAVLVPIYNLAGSL
jgi:type IV pilus assembly protein PilC